MSIKALIPAVHFTFREALRCTTAGLSNAAHTGPGVELLLDAETGAGWVCRKDAITFVGPANLSSAQVDPKAIGAVRAWIAERNEWLAAHVATQIAEMPKKGGKAA